MILNCDSQMQCSAHECVFTSTYAERASLTPEGGTAKKAIITLQTLRHPHIDMSVQTFAHDANRVWRHDCIPASVAPRLPRKCVVEPHSITQHAGICVFCNTSVNMMTGHMWGATHARASLNPSTSGHLRATTGRVC